MRINHAQHHTISARKVHLSPNSINVRVERPGTLVFGRLTPYAVDDGLARNDLSDISRQKLDDVIFLRRQGNPFIGEIHCSLDSRDAVTPYFDDVRALSVDASPATKGVDARDELAFAGWLDKEV